MKKDVSIITFFCVRLRNTRNPGHGHQADRSIGKNLIRYLISITNNTQQTTNNKKRGPPGKEAPLRKSQPLISIYVYIDALLKAIQ